jgi:hypothetical protein
VGTPVEVEVVADLVVVLVDPVVVVEVVVVGFVEVVVVEEVVVDVVLVVVDVAGVPVPDDILMACVSRF